MAEFDRLLRLRRGALLPGELTPDSCEKLRPEEGVCPPAAKRILPRSLPYAGGGASVPIMGARPHFFTFASI